MLSDDKLSEVGESSDSLQQTDEFPAELSKASIVFLHPDLGIGGAERLVVDAGLALRCRGYKVQFVTAHHDRSHCFQETVDGRLPVIVCGDWLPRSIFGKCYALCSYLRMIYAAIYLMLFYARSAKPDLIFTDQISACIPIIHLLSFFSTSHRPKILFYCHFPDQLLTTRKNLLKIAYRWPIDILEEWSTAQADMTLVNSSFTGSVFKNTFTRVHMPSPDVLYPSLNMSSFDRQDIIDEDDLQLIPKYAITIFLSINRYERKKNLALALRAFAKLKHELDEDDYQDTYLIMAGGYDHRVSENVEHYTELVDLASHLNITDNVIFLQSPSDVVKRELLRRATCLLYTPSGEHFGIVPIEAMYMCCPVIAVNNGGPLETILHGDTGYLCPPTDKEFCQKMLLFAPGQGGDANRLKERLGNCGRNRVIECFSFTAFTDKLDAVIQKLIGNENQH